MDSGTINRREFLGGSVSATGVAAASSLLVSVAPRVSFGATVGRAVDTASGKLEGTIDHGVAAFKGIPYAGPTEGEGRFMPPRPISPWTGVRSATHLGPPAMQAILGPAAWQEPGLFGGQSENCLVLNVWTPAVAPARKPVMVYFHPGGYGLGTGGAAVYDGANLARRGDVVVVTINNRLNVFGYAYLGDYSDKYAVGNVGHLDCVAALKWVQENIAQFGGDPGNVTAWGISGGGWKVAMLLAMPDAKGLFHKAIISSGPRLIAMRRSEATHAVEVLLNELGLTGDRVDELQKIPAQRLLTACVKVAGPYGFGSDAEFGMVVDGHSLPTHPGDPVAQAGSAGIPLLIGCTRDESAPGIRLAEAPLWGYLPGDKEMSQLLWDDTQLRLKIVEHSGLGHLGDEKLDSLIAAYRSAQPESSRLELLHGITSQRTRIESIILAERRMKSGSAPVYMYSFDWRGPVVGGLWAAHGSDIPFIFDNMDYEFINDDQDTPQTRAKADPSNDRLRIRDKIVAAWTAFVRSGDPSNELSGTWPTYNTTRRPTMLFDRHTRVEDDPRAQQRIVMTEALARGV